MTIVDIIEQGHRKHIYNGTQDEGEYEESLSYREQLLNNILSISSTSNYYNDYEGFKNDYFNSLSTVARYCGYNIYLLPLMQYRDGITGNIVPEKVVIKVEEISFDKWNGKIKLTDDVITQRLIDNFILICKSDYLGNVGMPKIKFSINEDNKIKDEISCESLIHFNCVSKDEQ